MNAFSLSGLLIGITSSAMSILVLWKGKRTKPNIIWSIFGFSVASWGIGGFFIGLNQDPEKGFLLWRLTHIGIIFIPVLFFHYTYSYLNLNQKKLLYLVYGLGIFFLIMDSTPFFIVDMRYVFSSFYWDSPHKIVYSFFVLFFAGVIVYTHYKFFKAIKQSQGLKRNQIRYLIFSTGLGFFGGGLSFLPSFNIDLYPWGNFTVIIYPIMFHLIGRYRLMDINLVFRYTTIYLLFAVVFSVPFLLLLWFIYPSYWSYLLLFVAMFAGPYFFQRFKEKLTSAVDLLPLFKGPYKKLKELEKYQDKIAEARTVQEWCEKLVTATDELFGPSSCSVLTLEKSLENFCVQAGRNIAEDNITLGCGLSLHSPLVKYLQEGKSILIKEMIDYRLSNEEAKKIIEAMTDIAAEISIPFFMKGQLIAILNLANRSDGNIYNDLILTSLWALGRAAEEVLRAIIIRIEFMGDISKLAHDLLKPFGFKGGMQYLPPMLKGEYGVLNEQQSEFLRLINDDCSFLEKYMQIFVKLAGGEKEKMYSLEPNSLTASYERVEEKFKRQSWEQGVKLVVNKPDPATKVNCDLQAIEYRVIFNLMDNAFRYTPKKGTIELGYELKDGVFIGRVRDSGKGIAKDNLEKIFEQGFQVEDGKKGLAGLGLAIIKEVMSAHNGQVWAESPGEGRGTTFYFSLPIVP